jgi:hypothetical protein
LISEFVSVNLISYVHILQVWDAFDHPVPYHVHPGNLLLKGGSMAGTNLFRKNAAAAIGLFIILVLACGNQAGNSSMQPGQNAPESGDRRTGQTGISLPEDRQQTYVPDEILVKFKTGTDDETVERIRAALNLETIRKFSSPNLFLMKITDGSTVETVIKDLNAYEAVSYAEPNYVVKATQ